MSTIKVNISKVNYPVSADVIRQVFAPVAPVTSANVHPQGPDGSVTAYLSFPTPQQAQHAMQERNDRCIYQDCNHMSISMVQDQGGMQQQQPQQALLPAPTQMQPQQQQPVQQPQHHQQQQQQQPQQQQMIQQQQQPPQMQQMQMMAPMGMHQMPGGMGMTMAPMMIPGGGMSGMPGMGMPGMSPMGGAPQMPGMMMNVGRGFGGQMAMGGDVGGRGGRGGRGRGGYDQMAGGISAYGGYNQGGGDNFRGAGRGRGGGFAERGGRGGGDRGDSRTQFVSLNNVPEEVPIQRLFELLEVFGGVEWIKRNAAPKRQIVTVKMCSVNDAHTVSRVLYRVPLYGPPNVQGKLFPGFVERSGVEAQGDPMDSSVSEYNFTNAKHRTPAERTPKTIGVTDTITVHGLSYKTDLEIYQFFQERDCNPENITREGDVSTILFNSKDNAVKAVLEFNNAVCDEQNSVLKFAPSKSTREAVDGENNGESTNNNSNNENTNGGENAAAAANDAE